MRVFFALAMLASCVRQPGSPSSGTLDIGNSGGRPSPTHLSNDDFLFSLPPCLETGCTESDKERLAAESPFEARIVETIDGATTSLHFSMFTFSRRPIFEALVRAARRGVKVLGLVDAKQFRSTASQCAPEGCTFTTGLIASPEYLSSPVDTRLSMLASEPLWVDGTMTDKLALLLHRLPSGSAIKMPPGKRKLVHNKYVVADERLLVTGSGNWSGTAVSLNLENLLRFRRDTSPAIVESYLCAFQTAFTSPGQTMSREMFRCQRPDLVYFSPSENSSQRGIVAKIIATIDATRSTVRISMHHLVHEKVFDALLHARQRGVSVRVLVDDDDCNLTDSANLAELQESGAEFRYVPTSCKLFQLAHNKYGVFDDATVVNGSANWSAAGLEDNYENFQIFNGNEAQAFSNHFENQWRFGKLRAACRCNPQEPGCRQNYCLDALPGG